MKIPNTLFTSYKCSQDDMYIIHLLNEWKRLNPTFNVLYFSDDDVHQFMFDYDKDFKYYNIYKHMKNGVAIADFFRILYIQKYGGYWFDIDLEPVQIETPYYIQNTEAIQLFDCGYGNISYMLIGAEKNTLLFQKVIDKAYNNILDNIKEKKNIF